MASHHELDSLVSRIKAQEPLISAINKLGCAPSLSIGVIHHGKNIYNNHFGCRNVQVGEPSDDNTTYFVGSLTKAMVSALVGIFVERGLLSWTTPLCGILPEITGRMGGRGSVMTLSDLLSHRVGMSRNDALWLQSAGNILLSKTSAIETWDSQPLVREFRADYLYNNFGYEITCHAIERVTGISLGANLEREIFEPLGMKRTSLDEGFPGDSNFARAYFALDNGHPVEVPIPTISDSTIMSAAGSVRSCTSDLVLFYSNFMHAANDQFQNKSSSTLGSPFKQLIQILRPHNQLSIVSLREESYALGWGRAELPSALGAFNYNKYLVPDMPIIGEGAPSRLVVYHGGSMQGFTSAVHLLPESETAVIALQNSTGLCDPCDWISQLLIETIFGASENKINFEKLAKIASATGATIADNIENRLDQAREQGTQPKELTSYAGKYWNSVKSFSINITVEGDGELYMCFQGFKSETYRLRHYHHDVFVWNESHNATARRGRFQTRPLVSYKITFESDGKARESEIVRLLWMFDESHPSPGVFVRDMKTLGKF